MDKDLRSNARKLFQRHPELWFFIFANVVFVIMYVWTMMTNPRVSEAWWVALFTGLTIIHVLLHWSYLKIDQKPNWFWPYVLVQGALAFAINELAQNMGVIFALYMALIGEVIGAGLGRRNALIASIFILSLSLVSFSRLMGVDQALWWMLGSTPMVVFVVMYVSLYTKQAKAHEEAQKLLSELEIAHTQLAEYANQVEELTLTTERQRMARELHDTLAQGLAGLILQLEAADSHLSNQHPQKAQTIVQQAMTRARTTLADARRVIGDLREENPPTNFNEAIHEEVERFQHTTGIRCKLSLCTLPSLSSRTAENAIRGVSEGLLNIAKHAEASEVSLTTVCSDEDIEIRIQDNGIGFSPDDVLGRAGHYGLLGLRERARLLGGVLLIESQPAKGTLIKIQLPLEDRLPVVENG
jgi:NarL family two-component system sensor histidine kinase YdfH